MANWGTVKEDSPLWELVILLRIKSTTLATLQMIRSADLTCVQLILTWLVKSGRYDLWSTR